MKRTILLTLISGFLLIGFARISLANRSKGGGVATDLYLLKGTTYDLLVTGFSSSTFCYSTGSISNQLKINPNCGTDDADYPVFYSPDGSHFYPAYFCTCP